MSVCDCAFESRKVWLILACGSCASSAWSAALQRTKTRQRGGRRVPHANADRDAWPRHGRAHPPEVLPSGVGGMYSSLVAAGVEQCAIVTSARAVVVSLASRARGGEFHGAGGTAGASPGGCPSSLRCQTKVATGMKLSKHSMKSPLIFPLALPKLD